jgi:hypothetical protein
MNHAGLSPAIVSLPLRPSPTIAPVGLQVPLVSGFAPRGFEGRTRRTPRHHSKKPRPRLTPIRFPFGFVHSPGLVFNRDKMVLASTVLPLGG